ncbi:MAG: sirohydrochlorin nickelochelatase [Methanomassiliicoccales archaeon]|jgi:sirohydrochlorin cobaltochelatase|nr:sirohydrochlorin nickelochelatase [Methanomassiliicoccales archaeon]
MDKRGILVVGHGSKLDYNKNVVSHYAAKLGERLKEFSVAVGFMNINRPTIKEGLDQLLTEGIDTVCVVPCFLAHGIHTRDDITSELGIPQGSKGGVVEINGKKITIKYCEPIGFDDRIVDILEERVRERLGKE